MKIEEAAIVPEAPDMEGKLKDLRKITDGLAKGVEMLGIYKETLSAKDSLLFAKAWMGKMLGAMGTESPYQNEGKRHLVEDIEPTADTAGVELHPDWETYSEIHKIDWLRQQIGLLIEDVEKIGTPTGGRKAGVLKENVFTHLCEARFWLGFRLESIREEAEG